MSETASPFAAEMGTRLRAARKVRGLSLEAVEAKSGGRWPASVAGSYERGTRAITVERLVELAEWYGVPVTDLLPYPPLVAETFTAITATQVAIRQRMAEAYEVDLAELRSEVAMLRSQIREAVA